MGVEKIKFSWKLYLLFLPEITSDTLKSGNEFVFFLCTSCIKTEKMKNILSILFYLSCLLVNFLDN